MTAGKTLALTGLANNATINLLGDVTFGFKNWNGPLMTIATKSSNGFFTFNGNGTSHGGFYLSTTILIMHHFSWYLGHTLNGQGQLYWDGKGSNGGATKPVSYPYSPCFTKSILLLRTLCSASLRAGGCLKTSYVPACANFLAIGLMYPWN